MSIWTELNKELRPPYCLNSQDVVPENVGSAFASMCSGSCSSGAEILSVKPRPVDEFVRFKATRGHNDPIKYTVQCRLAGEASD